MGCHSKTLTSIWCDSERFTSMGVHLIETGHIKTRNIGLAGHRLKNNVLEQFQSKFA